MVAVITGDIINSRIDITGKWRIKLKQTLNQFGSEPVSWEIFRGDSFQLELEPIKALKASIQIKSAIKQIKGIDVRMGIGVGEKEFQAVKITESTGSAFINSGECFDRLKKYSLAIKTNSVHFDMEMNLYIILSLLTLDSWSPVTSRIVEIALKNPELSQKEIALKLQKSKSTISEGLKRAGFDELMKVEKRYRDLILNKYK